MEALRRPTRMRSMSSSYELLADPGTDSPRTPSLADTLYDPTFSRQDTDIDYESTKRGSRQSSRLSLAIFKHRAPAIRGWLRTIVVQLAIVLWLAPIAVLLWLNFSSYRIGAALWCPKGDCKFNPFTPDSFKHAMQLEKQARNLLGSLQLVAKALEVWFVAIASGFIYTLASFLVVRRAGLPLSLYTAYVEFSDIRTLVSGEYWNSMKSLRRRNGERQQRPDWILIMFVLLIGLLCILANLMGPAVAVLSVPRLQQLATRKVPEKLFDKMSSEVPPSGNASIPFCTERFFADENYNCTYTAYGAALDAWVASGQAFQSQRPYVASLWPNGTSKTQDKMGVGQSLYAISQEWAVSFAFNATTDGGLFWTPSRQVLRNVSGDLEHFYALTNNNASMSDLFDNTPAADDPTLVWRQANASAMFQSTRDETFGELSSSLQTMLRRRGPALGAQINFFQFNDSQWLDIESEEKSIYCMQGWTLAFAADASWNGTKCLATGLKWNGGMNLSTAIDQWLKVTDNRNGSTDLKFGMHYTPKAIYFNETVQPDYARCFPFNVNRTELPANCDYDSLFENSKAPADNHDYLLDNVHTIFFNMDGEGAVNSTLNYFGIEFNPRVALADYTLDTSPFTNTLRLVELNNLPEIQGNASEGRIKIHPSWLNVIFSSYRATDDSTWYRFKTETSTASNSILQILQDIWMNYGSLAGLYEQAADDTDPIETINPRQDYYSLFYASHLLTLHMLSMLPFAALPFTTSDASSDKILSRNAIIEVWAYGLETRTSQMGISVVLVGCVIVLGYITLGFLTQVRVRSPTALLAGALIHAPDKAELDDANDEESKVGRIRFGSNFVNGGWLKYDKIL